MLIVINQSSETYYHISFNLCRVLPLPLKMTRQKGPLQLMCRPFVHSTLATSAMCANILSNHIGEKA